MNGFLNVNCGVTGQAFTRVGNCSAFEGTPKALIFHPMDESYDATDSKLFTTALDADLANGSAFAITAGIVNVEPSGGESRVQQEGFGPSKANGWDAYSEVYTINAGGFCLLKQLLKVDGRDYRMFIVDDKDAVYGEAVASGNEIRGFSVSLGVSRRANNGSEGGAIRLSAHYSLDYFKQMTRIAAVNYEGDDIVTVTAIRLLSTGTTQQYHLVDACSGEKLDAATIATMVPSKVVAYVIGSNGTVSTVTPTHVAGNKYVTITATAGLQVGLRLVTPGTALGTDPLFFGLEDVTVTAF